jgi:hypothetical protein
MTGSDAFDDTSADHGRFEAGLISDDQDAARVATADIDDEMARHFVSNFVDASIVIPVAEERVLVHEPSSKAFESITQLATFYRGWMAARDAGKETT